MEEKEVKQEEPKRVMEVKRAVVVDGGGGISPRFLQYLQNTITKYDGSFKELAKK